jgi:hypothetical protein
MVIVDGHQVCIVEYIFVTILRQYEHNTHGLSG